MLVAVSVNMEIKSYYTREELTRDVESCGETYRACSLCGGVSLTSVETLFPDDHEDDCPLSVVGVLGVDVTPRIEEI